MKKRFPLSMLLIIAVAFILVPDLILTPNVKPIKISVKATPSDFKGFCPKKIIFKGIIAVKKPMRIVYRWIRSDGAKGPVKNIYFRIPGIKSVLSSWTIGTGGKSYIKYWKAIEIIKPFHFVSKRAYFSLKCIPKIVLPDYRISGLVHGGRDGRIIGGRKVIVRINSGSFSRSQTLSLDRNGEATYTFSAMLFRGTYTITVRKGPSDPDNYTATANACYRGADPVSRTATLSPADPHAENQNFLINFVIAWDRHGDCWDD